MPLSQQEFLAAQTMLGWNNIEAACFFRVHEGTISGWRNGKPIPPVVRVLLNDLVREFGSLAIASDHLYPERMKEKLLF